MNAVFWIIMIAVSIIVIAYAVLLLRAQHTAKNLKITLWDNCGYSTTKNIHTSCVGDHHHFKHPTKQGKVTVTHPVKDIPYKTLKRIENQSGVRFP